MASSSDLRSLTEIVRTDLSILFSKPLKTFPGPTSTNVVTPCEASAVAAWVNLTGRGQLLDEQLAIALGILELRRHGRHELDLRDAEVRLLDRRPKPLTGPLDERRVERARDAKPNRAARALELGLAAALVDRERLARDDDLARAVVVRGPDIVDLVAERLDHAVGKAEDRRHRARVLLRRLGHRQPALAHQRDRVGDRQGAGRAERGELADRVADDVVRDDSARAQRRIERKRRRDQRRLLHLGVDQSLDRAVEAELLQVHPGGL